MLLAVEQKRRHLSQNTEAKKKSLLGQFLTPEKMAVFMANLFPDGKDDCRLLDAGAGIGSLSAAFLDRWNTGGFHFRRVVVDAFEFDSVLLESLIETLLRYSYRDNFLFNIHCNYPLN